MRKKIIIALVIVVGIIVLLFINRFKFSFYTHICGDYVQKQFEEKYGLDTEILYISSSESDCFGGTVQLETKEGVFAYCDYNLIGKMTSDSYSNIVYAYADIERVDQHVKKYFDDYKVIESFEMSEHFDDFYYESYKVAETSSVTYEDYLDATSDHQRYILVQLCEEQDLTSLNDLLQDLEKEFANQDNFTVFIKNYPKDVYAAYEKCEIFIKIAHCKDEKYYFNHDAMVNNVSVDYGPLYDFYVVGEYNFNGETKIIDNPLPADRGF